MDVDGDAFFAVAPYHTDDNYFKKPKSQKNKEPKINKDYDDNIVSNVVALTATVTNTVTTTVTNVVTLGLLNSDNSEKCESPRK